MDLASLFPGTAAAVRSIFLSHTLPEPARKLAKTLDQGLRAVERLKPGADVLQPRHVGISRFITQRQLIVKNQPLGQANPMVQQQKILMYVFPVMFAVFGINFPIGVLIYWLTTNL